MKLDRNLHKTLLKLAEIERAEDSDVKPVSVEEEQLTELLAQEGGLRNAYAAAQMVVDDMETEILRIQADERKLLRRKKDDEESLKSVVDEEKQRDLKHDLYSTKSRISDLMNELAEAHNEIHALRSNRDIAQMRVVEIEDKIAALKQTVAAAAETLKPEQSSAAVAEELKAALPTEVVVEFEKRFAENGIGVAVFNGRSCDGCGMQLSARDVIAIEHAREDELFTCPECGSLLIRATTVEE